MVTTVRVREDRLRTVALRPSSGEARLRRLALAAGTAGLVQAVAVAVAAPGASFPLTATAAGGGGTGPVVRPVTEVPVAVAAAAVVGLPAVAHLVVGSRWGFPRYVASLRRRDGSQRRLPALLGGPAMVGAVALRAGVSDLTAVLALVASSVVAAVLGPPPAGVATLAGHLTWPPGVAWALAVLAPWPILGAHLVVGTPAGSTAAAVAVVGVGAGWAVLCLVLASVTGGPHPKGQQRYTGGEAATLALGLVVSSSVAWLLVAAPGPP